MLIGIYYYAYSTWILREKSKNYFFHSMINTISQNDKNITDWLETEQ